MAPITLWLIPGLFESFTIAEEVEFTDERAT